MLSFFHVLHAHDDVWGLDSMPLLSVKWPWFVFRSVYVFPLNGNGYWLVKWVTVKVKKKKKKKDLFYL